MTSRREFLWHSALAATVVATPAWARTISNGLLGRVSVAETHVFPEWLSAMAEAARSGNSADQAFWNALQPALSVLDHGDASGEFRLLTLAAPGVEPFALDAARRLAAIGNDRLAERVRSAGGQLGGLATVVASDPTAVREAERAINDLKLTGLALGVNRGMNLHDARLWPLYAFAENAGVPVYLPAAYSAIVGDAPYRAVGNAGVITGAAGDSGRHATQLIFGGVLDAFPNLRVVLARLGEGTPYWYGEMAGIYAALQSSGRSLPRRAAEQYFQDNILLTTADMESRGTLAFCSAMIGEGRLLSAVGPSPAGVRLASLGAESDLRRLTSVDTTSLLARG